MAEFPPTLGLTNRRDLPDADRLFWVATAFVGFATLFTLTWAVSRVWAPVSHTFNKFDFKGRCDWASRVPSVVHANLVLWFLWHENLFSVTWNEWFQTADDLSVLERNMCISAGYFLYDFIIIVWSKMDLWQIYVFHHVAALWPLLSVLFNGCQNYTFFGTGFFFVEMTIMPLQFVHWCETLKKPDHLLTKFGYHATFWLWIPFRLVLPVYMTYNGIGVVMQQDSSVGFWQCKVPVGQGGASIWAFCWLIFFVHIGPGYVKRVFRGEAPAEHPAPATKERKPTRPAILKGAQKAKLERAGAATGSPMSPVMSPTFKASA